MPLDHTPAPNARSPSEVRITIPVRTSDEGPWRPVMLGIYQLSIDDAHRLGRRLTGVSELLGEGDE